MRWYVTTWAWLAMYRRVLHTLMGQRVQVVGDCRGCGRCCREIVLHVSGRWIRTESQFEREKRDDPDLARYKPIDEDDDGRIIFKCTLLHEDGLCGDYENRLELCRKHPQPDLYYSGVTLAPHCGYRFKEPGLRDLLHKLTWFRSRSFDAALGNERLRNRDTSDEEE